MERWVTYLDDQWIKVFWDLHFLVSCICFGQHSTGKVSFYSISQTVVPKVKYAPYLLCMVMRCLRNKWMTRSRKPLSWRCGYLSGYQGTYNNFPISWMLRFTLFRIFIILEIGMYLTINGGVIYFPEFFFLGNT